LKTCLHSYFVELTFIGTQLWFSRIEIFAKHEFQSREVLS